MRLVPAVVGVLLTVASHVVGHGRLMDPPARNSMWRLGFPNPVNYNDNELYCGGRITQWARNKGKCGVCGDPHHHPTREHEVGGKYANGIISRQYSQGDAIEVTVHITANHKGYFEFRICPVADPKVEVTQECLDQHVLEMANGDGSRYQLPEGKSNQFFNVSLRLPADVTCKQCVIQWKYRTGNTWDKDESGQFCVGCGPQEEFYNCADVTIHAKDSQQVENPKGQATKDTENQKSTNVDKEAKLTRQSIMFTDEAYNDKMTDYGKQKVKFVNKLQTNKYSTWDHADKTVTKSDKGVVSLAPTREYSRLNTGSGSRFGYLANDYTTFNQGVKASQPSGVTYRWKTDNFNSPDLENVHSRFGFTSSTKKYDNGVVSRNQINENQLQHANNNVHNYSEEKKETIRGKEMQHYKKNDELQSQTKAASQRDSSSARPTTPQPNVKIARSEYNALDKAVVKLHTQLREILNNAKVNPQQRDNFLRRWKLLRLRQIAVRKALNASFDSANSKPQLLSQPPKISKNHINRDLDIIVTPALSLVAPQPRERKEQNNEMKQQNNERKEQNNERMEQNYERTEQNNERKERNNERKQQTNERKEQNNERKQQNNERQFETSEPHQSLTPAKPTESHKSVKQSTTRRTLLKHKLPSWLVTTLKLKHRDGETSNNNYKNDNKNKEIFNSENGINTDSRNQHKENSVTKWYNKNLSSKKQDFYPSETNLQGFNILGKVIAPTEMSESEDGYEKSETHMLDSGIKAANVADNEASENAAYKNKESGITEDTESLVRYIVKLLLARKHGHGLNKSPRKSPTSQFISDNTKTTESLSIGSHLKDNVTVSFSKSAYESDDYNIRKYVGHDQGQQTSLYANEQEDRGIFEYDHPSKSSNNEQPLVRAEAQAFNGLVLGSDLAYNQSPARSTNHGNQNWESAKSSTKEDEINTQVNNLGNSLRRNDNYHNQHTSYDVSYDKPFSNGHYQKPIPQSPRFNSQMNAAPENGIDYHHIWSARALNRQGYYNNKQEIADSRLQCRSLVTLGGGMDQWCTDNCNANFCPPSMCVCMPSLPTASVYVRNSLPVHSSTSQRQQQIGAAMTNHGTEERTYRNLGYIPQAGNYITADVRSHGKAPLPEFLPENRDGSYMRSRDLIPAPSVNHPMTGNNFHEGRDSSNMHSINVIGSRSNNRGPMRMYHSDSTDGNIDHSSYTNPFYSQYLGEATQNRPAHIDTVAGFGQRGVQDSLRHNHREGSNIGALPYISNNIVRSDFQEYDTNPDLSVRDNWLTNPRTVLENRPQQSILRENLIKPFSSHQNQRHNTLLSPNDGFSRQKTYTRPEIVGQNFVGQNQFYPQFTNLNGAEGQVVHPTLKCKAIGAYTGLKHFDEWCDSTCQSAMCPLLICSCDN